MNRFSIGFWMALSVLVLVGCSHYQLGRSVALPFQSIYVAPVVQRAAIPQVQGPLSQELVLAFTAVPDLRVEPRPTAADVSLRVTVTGLQRTLAATQVPDTARAQGYDLELAARVTLVDRDGTVLMEDRRIVVVAEAFAVVDYQDAEAQALQVLARDLAENIRDAVTAAW